MWGNGHGSHYRILVSRACQQPSGELYPFSVRQPIPDFPLPLQTDDTEPWVKLNRILHDLYERAGYDLRINYRGDATPPLEGDDATWADARYAMLGYAGHRARIERGKIRMNVSRRVRVWPLRSPIDLGTLHRLILIPPLFCRLLFG